MRLLLDRFAIGSVAAHLIECCLSAQLGCFTPQLDYYPIYYFQSLRLTKAAA